jgi:hypothetical protein
METLEGFLELPGALFRKLITARDKSFEQVLKDHTKKNWSDCAYYLFWLFLL